MGFVICNGDDRSGGGTVEVDLPYYDDVFLCHCDTVKGTC